MYTIKSSIKILTLILFCSFNFACTDVYLPVMYDYTNDEMNLYSTTYYRENVRLKSENITDNGLYHHIYWSVEDSTLQELMGEIYFAVFGYYFEFPINNKRFNRITWSKHCYPEVDFVGSMYETAWANMYGSFRSKQIEICPFDNKKDKSPNNFMVLLHEFSHAMGLQHSNNKLNIMFLRSGNYVKIYEDEKLFNNSINYIRENTLWDLESIPQRSIKTISVFDIE